MKLPITGWDRTLKALGRKVVWKRTTNEQSKRKRDLLNNIQQYEALEPRQLLAGDTGLTVQADLSELLATFENPLVARLGQFNNDATQDLAIVSSDGQLTVATNGGDDTWQTRQTVDLGTGPLQGVELALVDDDVFADLILQGPDNIFVALNDGDGNFTVSETLTPLPAGALGNASGDPLRLVTGDFNGDFTFDVAAIAPGTDQLVVYLGVGDGTFGSPSILSTGGNTPTSITSGDFVRDALPDLAVGHADGTVTFLQNEGDGLFTLRADLTRTGFNAVTDLASADLDEDGDADIVVASGDDLTILQNERVESDNGPVIANGTFGQNLTAWNTEIVGQPDDTVAGSVIAQSGFAQLIENQSFLVSINQPFVVPDAPERIEVDILSLGLEDPNGGIPDAFEISILDDAGNSLVPTFQPHATSFFNANPGEDGDETISLAPGVTFDGTTVSVDISGIAAGTAATIYFDLIGNPSADGGGNSSTVTIDNIVVTPENEFDHSFSPATLQGPFLNVNRVLLEDVDGDAKLDVVATDAGGDQLLVFNGRGGLTFEREEIDLSALGTGLVSLDAAPLTAGDDVSDLVVLARDSRVAISPLSADNVGPTAELLSPAPSQTNSGTFDAIEIQFDEAIQVGAETDLDSATNPANYSVVAVGADGLPGTADDVVVDIESVTIGNNNRFSLNLAANQTPLADGIYRVTLDGTNLTDISENLLNDGQPVVFMFTINSQGPQIAPVDALTGEEGAEIALSATFTDAGGATPYSATINWGDGSSSAGTVTFANGTGTIEASHVYADNGTYNVTISVQDSEGVASQAITTANIANVAPVVSSSIASINVDQGQAIDQLLATFTDPGFSNSLAGTTESFTASIDWGDGTTSDGTVSVTSGSAGTLTTGNVSGSHIFAAPGTYTVVISVADDDGGSDSATLTVEVADVAAELESIAPVSGDEGSPVDLLAAFTDGPSSGTYAATIDWGDSTTTTATIVFADGIGTIEGSHVYGDNGSYDVSIQLTDAGGNVSVGSTTATIENVAPSIAVAANQTVTEGTSVTFTLASFSDPGFTNVAAGTEETFTANIDWGDGTTSAGEIVLTVGAAGVATMGTISGDHAYAVSGDYTVTVTVTDDDGESDSGSLVVTVDADLPVISSVDPIIGNEGQEVSLATDFTDGPTNGTYVAVINWGDGTTTNANVTFADGQGSIQGSHTYADNDIYNVSIELTDPTGNTAVSTTTTTINNIAPTLVPAADQNVDQGAQLSLAVVSFTDPGFSDLAVGSSETFTASINWGDGTVSDGTVSATPGSIGVLTTGSVTGDHIYAAPGVYTVQVTVSDDDGGTSVASFTVEVTDVPAVISAIDPVVADEGSLATLQADFTDQVSDGSYAATINWGDGSTTPATVVFADGNGTIEGTHVYADNGNYGITVQLTDPAGNESTQTTTATIDNVRPTIIAANDQTIDVGQVLDITVGSFSDPGFTNALAGTTETFTATVDWGDGEVTTGNVAVTQGGELTLTQGTVLADHVYSAAGTFTVTLTVVDDDGGTSSDTFDVTVNALDEAPVLGSIDPINAVEDTSTNLTATFTDIGPEGTYTATIEWGDGTSSPGTVTFSGGIGTIQGSHVYSDPGTFDVSVQIVDVAGNSDVETTIASVTPAASDTGVWLPNIDFDTAAFGNELASGEVITDQWAQWGVNITTHDPVNHPALIFDSSNPTGGDTDLGTPNVDFGGPGVGNGGRTGSAFTNSISQNNILIISEDGDTSDPDDLAAGGTFIFTFDNAVMLDEIRLLDIDNGESAFIRLYDAAGDLISSQSVTGSSGGNGFHIVDLSADFVSRMEVELAGSGAITDLIFCRDGHLSSPAVISGPATIEAGEAYALSLDAPIANVAAWTIVWGDGTSENVPAGTTTVSHVYSGASQSVPIVAYATTDGGDVYESNELTVELTSTGDSQLPTIDFETQANSQPLASGDVITDQFAALGVHVTTNDPVNHPAMIFDSSFPTGGDADLGTPNAVFGGPGNGTGGQSGLGINDQSLGNILIISEDADSSDPDDNIGGGTLIFTFDAPVTLDEIGLLDIDSREAFVRLYDASGAEIANVEVNGQGNNSYIRVALDAVGVSRMEVEFTGSGALTEIEFTRGANVIEELPTRFFTVDGVSDRGFQYTATGQEIGDFNLENDREARGVTTTATGNPVWVVKSNEFVYVYDRVDNTFLGEWDAIGPRWARGIATNGDDIWIVDARNDRVYYYEGGADFRGGAHQATSSFRLDSNNGDSSGLEVFGDTLWVTDASSDRVFVYNTDGSSVGNWQLDSANARSSGITTDATGQHLWVTDYDDGQIYYYENAASRTSGSLAATSTIDLGPNNQNPEGIADPTIPINIGDSVSGAISVPGEEVTYTIPSDGQQRVFLDFTAFAFNSGGRLDVEFIAPDGQTLHTDNVFAFESTNPLDFGPLDLNQVGDYQLLLDGRGSDTGSFEFDLVSVPAPSFENIEPGDVITDSIEIPGQVKSYLVTSTGNETIVIDFQSFGGSSTGNRLQFAVFAPDGTQVLLDQPFVSQGANSLDTGRIELSQAGEYEIFVNPFGDDDISYQFQLIEIFDDTASIELDEVVSGSLDAYQLDTYELSISSPTSVFLDFQALSAPNFERVRATFTAPDGTVIDSSIVTARFGSSQLDAGRFDLTQTGTYEFTLLGSGSDVIPNYQFSFIELEPVVPQVISLNEVVTGDITIGDEDVYQLNITDPEVVFFDVQGLSSVPNFERIGIEVTSPTGATVYNRIVTATFGGNQLDAGPFSLDEAGTYEIRVVGEDDDLIPNYQFQVIDVPEPDVVSLNFNQLYNGTTETFGESDVYLIDANAGDVGYLDIHRIASSNSTVNSTTVQLIAPDGSTVFSSNASPSNFRPERLVDFDQTGQYQLVLTGIVTQLIDYDLVFWQVPADVPTPVEIEQTVTGIRVPSQTLTYNFDAAVGDELTLATRFEAFSDANSGEINYTLTSPSGVSIFADRSSGIVLDPLTETGTYTLTIDNTDAADIDAAGTFSFQVFNTFEPITVGETDSQGTDFWLGFPTAFTENNPRELSLFITSDVDTQAIVSLPGLDFLTFADVRAGEVVEVLLPEDGRVSGNGELIEARGIRVIARDEVAVYGLHSETRSTDAFLALPVDSLGTEYIAVGYEAFPLGNITGTVIPSQLGVIATTDNTTVTITPVRSLPNRPANVPFDVILNAGDVYQLQDGSVGGDITGTSIVSDQPVAVVSGHSCAQVPLGTPACDYLIEQIPPTNTWGTEYLSTPLAVRTAGDTFRIIASEDNTVVTINGVQVATLDQGEFHETVLTERSSIVGSNPILAVQFSNSSEFDSTETDPFMLLLTPSEQFRDQYTFTTLDDESFPTGHFVNVTAPAEGLASLQIDGITVDPSLFAPIPGSNFLGAQIQVTEGSHQISSDLPFGLAAYGFGSFDSYGYNAGTALSRVAEVAAIATTADTSALLVDQTLTLTTLVTDDAGQPVPEILVNYQITGANSQSAFAITDENGVATLSYVGTNEGQDSIVSFVGQLIDTDTVNWETVSPNVTITSPTGGTQFTTGSSQLVTGRALPGAPDVEIVDVTINGLRVDSLDPSGTYFALVDIADGSQTIEVTATDRLGNTTTETISVIGLADGPVDPTQFSDVADSAASFEYARTSFNRQTNKLNVDYTVTNNGTPSIGNGSLALFDGFNPVSVSVIEPDGSLDTNDGSGYFVLDAEVPADGLRTGQVSTASSIKISNPNRERFDFDAQVLTQQNEAPNFVSAPVVVVAVGNTYNYDADAIDPNGQAVTYSLITAPAGLTIDPETGQLNWTASNAEFGIGNAESATHDVQIQADDGEGGIAVQSFTLTVTAAAPDNRGPVITSPASDTFNVAAAIPVAGTTDQFTYEFSTAALDPDGDAVTWSVANEPNGLSIDGVTGDITWTVTTGDLGNYSFDLLATDSAGNLTTQSFALNIVDQAPATITGTVFDDTNVDGVFQAGETGISGRTVYLDLNENAQPDTGEPIAVTGADGSFNFTGLLAGTYAVGQVLETGRTPTWGSVSNLPSAQIVTVAAGQTVSGIDFGSFDNGNTDNTAPTITSDAIRTARVNRSYGYQVVARDADGDSLTYQLLNAPDGVVINPDTGLIQWTPTADQLSFQDILIQVDDGNGNVDVQAFDVLVTPEFQAPSITSTPDLIATIDETYEYAVVAEDPDNQMLTYDLVSGPADASVDPITGVLTWNPTADDLGDASFTVSATDEDGLVALQSFDVSVRNVNEGPVFQSTPILEATAGAEYRYTAVATDSEDAVAYTLTDGPVGLTVDPDSGLVRWLPTADQIGAGVDVIVTATDERGLSTDQTFSITVVADTQAPDVSITNENTVFDVGDTYRFQVGYTDNVAVDNVVVTLQVLDNPPQTITLDQFNIGEFIVTEPGIISVEATVTDVNGNVATDSTRVRAVDPNDVTAPTASIDSPTNLTEITYLTDIVATVTSDDDLDFWIVDYSLTGSNNWNELARGTTDIDGQVVATFDPTLLQNDSYDIRIRAFDYSGNFFTISNTVNVDGAAKLGNYATQFVDLQVPLAGIPITITRQYDTLRANETGDFGYGWNLGIAGGNVRESLPVGQGELDGVPALFGGSEPFFAGTQVFVTTPEGQRVAFEFQPVLFQPFAGIPTLVPAFQPRFVSDQTDWVLEVEDIALSQRSDGTFGLYLFDLPYNPSNYSLVSRDQVRYDYDQFDGLQQVTDRNGVTLDYRDDGIFSSTGESIQFVRDAQGRITEIIDPAGNSLTYTYSDAGDLLTFTDQVDNTWTHEYFNDPAHFLQEITGPRGNTLQEVQFDDDGRFAGLVDGLGNVIEQSYDLENNQFFQTDRNGNVTELEFDDRGNITLETNALGGETVFEYADPRHPRLETAITDQNGNTTRFEFDARGNVTLLEEPGGVFTRFEYDSFNNVTRTIGPATSDPGDGFADTLIDSFFADGVILGTTVGERLDEVPFREIDSADIILGPEFDRDTQTQRDSDYVLLAQPGDFVTVGFDEDVRDRDGDDIFIITPLFGGNFVNQGEQALVSVTTDGTNYLPVAQVSLAAVIGVDLADAGITDEILGVRITAVFSDDGNDENDFFPVVAVQATTGDFRTTRNIYDERGNLVESIDAVGNSQLQTIDSFGRPLTVTDRNGNTTTLEYDQLIGSPTLVINPDDTTQQFTYDDLGRPLTQTNELGTTVQTITYDDSGRQLTVAGADGQLTTNVYDGELLASETVRISATEDQVTSYEYDDNNRLFRQTDGIGAVVELEYDANGNVLSLTDPVGNETSYVFDALDRQIQETDPLGNITTYAYDAVGNLTLQTDRLGRQIEFQYDERDRQTAELWYSADGTLIETSTYTYDIFNNLLTADDAESSYTYEYDVLDRLIRSDNAGTPNAPNVILTYAYDANSNRTQVSDNSGVTIDSEYGSRNELLSKNWHGGEVDDARVEYDYDDALRQTDTRRYSDLVGDGTTNLIGRTETAYDDTGRRIQITHLDGSDIVLANYEYEFDQANRITQQTIDDDIVDYTYDLTGQLLTADHSDPSIPDEFYRYDLNGNRIESHLHGSDYVTGANNQLLSDGEFNYEYDDEGNQIRRTNIATGEFTEFEYDHRNRLIRQVNKSSGGIITSESQFVFDVFGRRIAVINDADGAGPNAAVRVDTVFDGDNAWTDYNEAGEAIARYLFGDFIDSNIARWRSGEGTAWYLTDHLGTVRVVVDALGLVQNQTIYDSFGQVLIETNAFFGDRFKFTGRELNSGNDYYYRSRVYTGTAGRFTTLDSIRFRGNDTNLYRSVNNNPLVLIDPFGEQGVENGSVTSLVTTRVIRCAVVLGVSTGVLIALASPAVAIPPGGGAIVRSAAAATATRETALNATRQCISGP